nr:MAG TPA: hypothetical protein [Caudoviricetes sp.]
MYGQPTYYPNPTLQTTQQRLQMMEAQYPQFAANPTMGYSQPIPQQTSATVPLLKGRPVSNEEEANAAMIDFDGSLFVFPDKAHGKIYTKQLGLDGNIIFLRYSLEQPPGAPSAVESSIDMRNYVKVEDLNQKLEEINERFTSLEQRLPRNSSESKGGNRR